MSATLQGRKSSIGGKGGRKTWSGTRVDQGDVELERERGNSPPTRQNETTAPFKTSTKEKV